MTERDIKLYDNSYMFGVLSNFGNQIEEAMSLGKALKPHDDLKNINKIIICGLGGSAIGGDLLRSYLTYEIKIPILINRNYKLPAFADENTLVIISSYSGNTEESLSSYKNAKESGCKIVCLSSGGKLVILAENENNFLIKIPRGYQPRCALGFAFFPLLILLSKLGFISDKSKEIEKTAEMIKRKSMTYSNYEYKDNVAIKIAEHLFGKIPVIYSSVDILDIVNLRWRGQINENAKSLAFGNLVPEMNHNEIVGWQENPDILKRFAVVSLIDREDNPSILKRMKITLDLIQHLRGAQIEIDGEGDSHLERIFDLIYLGDWVSFYLAILYKVDPTPVEKINFLKNKLLEN